MTEAEAQKTNDATFSPAVLIVDDDASVRRYYREKFHDETSVGVVTASTLAEAKELLDSGMIKIDAIVADLFFDHGKDAPDRDLLDGLDILAYTQELDPEISKYVLSYWSSRPERLAEAKKRKLTILKWFEKEVIYSGERTTAPWATVERELLARRLRGDPSLAARVQSLTGESRESVAPVSEDLVAEAIRTLHPPIRTYLQSIDDSDPKLTHPIEVICFRDQAGTVSSNAWRLGLFLEGNGDSVRDALADLASKIVGEYQTLISLPDDEVIGYARLVRDRLRKHFDEPTGARA
jgi:hypothetical protein